MERSIAIIGIGGKFPEANNINELAENLKAGKVSIRKISDERIKRTCLIPTMPYRSLGYIDDIDTFDYEFFNISLAEAKAMSPQQRILLEVAYQTIENAGYTQESLKDKVVSVFSSITSSNYSLMAEESSPLLATGTSSSFIPARICRQFNLTGNSQVIDSNCSSSLVAIHMACNELILQEADMVMVCGANFELFPIKSPKEGLGVDSPNDTLRPLSSAANGMVQGEVATAVLLKRLDKALEDKDLIHAVIKSSGVNNNADRSASISAPDSITQTEVIRSTWQKAGIKPNDIEFIEVHGSGTQLGDTIEIEALNEAFNNTDEGKNKCYASTIKANIGHSRAASGIAGLIKAVLSLKEEVIFPMPEFDSPNPFINMDKAAIRVNTEPIPWKRSDKTRLAGVTSIGLSGTNCHVVLEESPSVKKIKPKSNSWVFPISGRDEEDLSRNIKALHGYLIKNNPCLDDFSYTLACTREHFNKRVVIEAEDKEELIKQLTNYNQVINKFDNLILIFSPEHQDSVDLSSFIKYLSNEFSVFSEKYSDFSNVIDNQSLGFQYAFYYLIESLGVKPDAIVGLGIGKVLTDVLSWKKDLDSLKMLSPEIIEDVDYELKSRQLKEKTSAQNTFFVDMAVNSPITGYLKNVNITSANNPVRFLEEIIKAAYLSGKAIKWREFYNKGKGRKIEIPGYQFKKSKCWIRSTPINLFSNDGKSESSHQNKKEINKPVFKDEIGLTIYNYWCEVLGTSAIDLVDDFFEIGGDSLKASKVIQKLNRDYQLNLSFEDIFDFSVLTDFTSYVNSLITPNKLISKLWCEALNIEDIKEEDNFFALGGHSLLANQVINKLNNTYQLDLNFDILFDYPTVKLLGDYIGKLKLNKPDLGNNLPLKAVPEKSEYACSSAQKQLWAACLAKEVSVAYNCINSYLIEEDINKSNLIEAVKLLTHRHETLRTIFIEKNGEPFQKIIPINEIVTDVEFIDLTLDLDQDTTILSYIKQEALVPFKLNEGPLFKIRVIKLNENKSVVVIMIHHIIYDSRSNTLLFNELIHLYNLVGGTISQPLDSLIYQYKDYAGWQKELLVSSEFSKYGDFWKEKLQGYHGKELMYTDYDRSMVHSYEGATHEFVISPQTLLKIKALDKQNNCTTFITLLAFVKLLIYRLSENRDIALGTPIAGRNNVHLEKIIGIFANTLIVRTKLNENGTFNEYMQEVIMNVREAFKYQHYPYDEILKDTKSQANSFNNIMMQYEKKKDIKSSNEGISLFSHNLSFIPIDIYFRFLESQGQLKGNILYNKKLFNKTSIKYFSDTLIRVIDMSLENPQVLIKSFLPESSTKSQQSVSDVNF